MCLNVQLCIVLRAISWDQFVGGLHRQARRDPHCAACAASAICNMQYAMCSTQCSMFKVQHAGVTQRVSPAPASAPSGVQNALELKPSSAILCTLCRYRLHPGCFIVITILIFPSKKSPHRGRAVGRRSPAPNLLRSRRSAVFSDCPTTGRRGWSRTEPPSQHCRSLKMSSHGSVEPLAKVAAPPLKPPSPPPPGRQLSAPPLACLPSVAACGEPDQSGVGPDSRRSLSAPWQG